MVRRSQDAWLACILVTCPWQGVGTQGECEAREAQQFFLDQRPRALAKTFCEPMKSPCSQPGLFIHFKKFIFSSHCKNNTQSFFFYFLFFCFLGPHPRHMEVPRLGVQSELQWPAQPKPQPEQLGIRAASVTYTTVHSNALSPTLWARPGIEPTFSWLPVGFASAVPRQEL